MSGENDVQEQGALKLSDVTNLFVEWEGVCH